jgi:periplasmic protein TonB
MDDDKTIPFERSMPSAASIGTTYRIATRRKAPRWAAPLLATIATAHVALFVAMWAKSIWDVERLDKPKGIPDIAVAPPPAPPPPPPKGSTKPQDVQIVPKKPKVRDIIQPVRIEDKTPVPDTGNTGGSEDGSPDGVENGVSTGAPTAAPPPIPTPEPPPAPKPPPAVAPTALEAQRIAGEKNIVPDDTTKNEIRSSGKDRIVSKYRLCIDAGGSVSTLSLVQSSSFADYDQKIAREMRQWRYRPFMVDGKAVPVCTVVTFIYSQH